MVAHTYSERWAKDGEHKYSAFPSAAVKAALRGIVAATTYSITHSYSRPSRHRAPTCSCRQTFKELMKYGSGCSIKVAAASRKRFASDGVAQAMSRGTGSDHTWEGIAEMSVAISSRGVRTGSRPALRRSRRAQRSQGFSVAIEVFQKTFHDKAFGKFVVCVRIRGCGAETISNGCQMPTCLRWRQRFQR